MFFDFKELDFSLDFEHLDIHMDINVEQTLGEFKTDLTKNPVRFGKPVETVI